ncbi:MAG TPA: GDYXXLXY domain-containing protein [Phenylobacterium sp.]|nr:GDYXXLXY domain-containing protein [Phenylobacterium sp.]
MTRSLTVRILGAAALLVALLVALVVRENHARATGREVRLPMEAVDPRDLLTGHYVALRLTQLAPAGQPCPPGSSTMEKPGWIALTPTATGDRVTGAGADRAAAAKYGPILLRGTARCFGDSSDPADRARITLDIGVDRFHADQRQSEAFDKALRDRKVGEASAWAIVSVGQDGKGRLKGVIIDGQRADLTWN